MTAPGPREGAPGSPPLVTVVIPTRNRAHRLEAAVRTVLEQSWERLEVVVVDDASDDRTPEVVASLADADPRVRSVRHASHRGAAAARNVGARAGTGSLLAFNDDDCTWSPQKLERQVAALGRRGVGVAYCPMMLGLGGGRERRVAVPDAERVGWPALLKRSFVPTPTLVMRGDLFEEVGGFDENLPALQDWDLALRVARLASFRFVPEVEVRTEYLEEGISGRTRAVAEACRRIRRKWSSSGLSPRERTHLQTAMGHILMMAGDPAEGRRMFRRALRCSPLALRPWILGGAALLGEGAYRGLVRWRERLQGTGVDRLMDRLWRG